VKGVVAAFAKMIDIGWDVWNEPDTEMAGANKDLEPKNKNELVVALLPKALRGAGGASDAALTSGV